METRLNAILVMPLLVTMSFVLISGAAALPSFIRQADPPVAESFQPEAAEPTPTAEPSPSPTPTPAATPTPMPTPTATATPFPVPTVPAEHSRGKLVIIDQALQMMYVFEDGLLLRIMPVSTGKPTPNTYTPAWEGRIGHYVGTFSSFGTTQDEGWYLFRADGGILIHGAPYVLVDGQKVYQELEALGRYPASYGCIRLSPEDAVWFTKWGPQGAYCIITPLPQDKFPIRQEQ